MSRFPDIPSFLVAVLKAAGITILAFILARLMAAPFSASTSAVFSSPEKTDFVLSDFYAQVADRRPVRKLSDRIVIVDIGNANRYEIAGLIGDVALCAPASIGVDINFEEPHVDDTPLLNSLKTPCPIVLPLGVSPMKNKKDLFRITDHAFFYDTLPGPTYGVVNLPGKYEISSIREFPVEFKLEDGKTLRSFVAELAKVTYPDAYEELMKRGREIEIIDYASLEIPVITPDEIYDNPERLSGKTIMIGAVNDAADTHNTPVRRNMSGILIHSYALSTVIEGNYYTALPVYADYLLAAVLCFCLILTSISMTAKVKGLLLRILQVLLAYFVVRIGYELYVEQRVVVNFTITLLMVAFGFFAIDVWNGCWGLWEFAGKWIRRLKARLHREAI